MLTSSAFCGGFWPCIFFASSAAADVAGAADDVANGAAAGAAEAAATVTDAAAAAETALQYLPGSGIRTRDVLMRCDTNELYPHPCFSSISFFTPSPLFAACHASPPVFS